MNNAYLIVPGLGNSGELHWQTLWEKKYDNFHRVEQQHWTNPNCSDWVNSIENSVSQLINSQIIIIAHSLGCIAVAHWAHQTNFKIAGALLVAPPDIELIQNRDLAHGFAPVPFRTLPFKSTLVASTNDEYADIAKSWQYAKFWNSEFVNIGNKGHINAESGFGEWPEGFNLLNKLVTVASYQSPVSS